MSYTDALLNDFAIRSFRDTADGDYIAARLSYRSQLMAQFLWQSLQALEKYLKCMLVLNRIKAPKTHELDGLIKKFKDAGRFQLRLSPETVGFVEYLDTYGRFRYHETPYHASSEKLFLLDKAVWEIRRYARVMDYTLVLPTGAKKLMLPLEVDRNERAESESPQAFTIIGGYLEKVLRDKAHPARSALVWHNLYFGRSRRTRVRHRMRSMSSNSPLSLHPEILDEVLKYVFLPKDVQDAYRKGP